MFHSHAHTQSKGGQRWLESNKTKVLTSIYGRVMQIFNYESIFNTQGWASSFTSEVIQEFLSSQSVFDDSEAFDSLSFDSLACWVLNFSRLFLLFASVPEPCEIFSTLPRHEYLHLSGPSTFHSIGVYLLKQHWPASEDYSRLRCSARKMRQSTSSSEDDSPLTRSPDSQDHVQMAFKCSLNASFATLPRWFTSDSPKEFFTIIC